MKKLLNAILFILFMGLIIGLLFFFANRSGRLQVPLFGFISGVLLLFTLMGLTYKAVWTMDTFKRRPFLASVILLVSVLILTYFSRISFQAYGLFKYLSTTNGKHWSGKVFEPDQILGHKPMPCNLGSLSLEYNHQLLHRTPVKFDENRFRIPVDTSCSRTLTRPLVLFLGDSFTEGADCNAEQTFSAVVGDSLHATYLNAGVSSYGFAQMFLLARTLIPKYKPDYLIVQNSPWLSQRAVSRYAPTFGLLIPSPYFTRINDSIQVVPPVFQTSSFSLTWKFNPAKSRLANFLSFYFKEGFYVCARDILRSSWANRTTPAPLADQAMADEAFFHEIGKYAEQYGSRLIVVNLGDIHSTANSHKYLNNAQTRFAEADSLLWKSAHADEQEFARKYYFRGWKGNDTVILDKHPTVEAHAIIANSIIQTIKN